MWFTILGSGTHFPDPQKRSAGYLLRDGKNLIQLDFGYGTLLRLVGMKVRYQDIRHIFLTHMHEDHYLDLLPFLNTLVIQVAQWGLAPCTLYLYGPKGFRKKLQNIRAAIGVKTTEPFVRIVFRELTRARVIMGKVTVRSHPVHHVATINALCYRIDKGRQSIAYIGDLVGRPDGFCGLGCHGDRNTDPDDGGRAPPDGRPAAAVGFRGASGAVCGSL